MAIQQDQIPDPQKIAILLASLDERVAAGVLQQLDPDVIGQVANSIRRLGIVPGAAREKVLTECFHGINSMGNVVSGDDKLIASLLTKAIGEKRATAMLADETTASRVAFEVLLDVSAEQIVSGLGSEQPAALATVLRHLPPEQAGEVLGLMPSKVRNKVIVHICKGKEPSAETLARIEKYVNSKFKQDKREDKRVETDDSLDVVAAILQNVDKSVSEELLSAIEGVSETVASQIKDKLFTFDDIIGLDDASIRRILQEVDMNSLAVALRNVSVDLKHKFFKNMSKRAGEGIKEEMEFAQKMKLSDIQARQKEIVEVIRSLDADGQISISGGGGGDEYV
jgi:flagellar motor switch protein FliG